MMRKCRENGNLHFVKAGESYDQQRAQPMSAQRVSAFSPTYLPTYLVTNRPKK
jgi:hypothetical protein